VKASARKKKPVTPESKPSGTNTTTVVRVDAAIGRAIFATASPIVLRRSALGFAASPRAIASMTTIVSSMINPTATARPPTLMRLSDRPERSSTSVASASASGMIAAATSVIGTLRKKK
jgi:hypothetical protein